MGILSQFLFGTVAGIVFVNNMDDYYYKVINRNVAIPVKNEFKGSNEIDVVKVFKVAGNGLKKSYEELYP